MLAAHLPVRVRGGPLAPRDERIRDTRGTLGRLVDVAAATWICDRALGDVAVRALGRLLAEAAAGDDGR